MSPVRQTATGEEWAEGTTITSPGRQESCPTDRLPRSWGHLSEGAQHRRNSGRRTAKLRCSGQKWGKSQLASTGILIRPSLCSSLFSLQGPLKAEGKGCPSSETPIGPLPDGHSCSLHRPPLLSLFLWLWITAQMEASQISLVLVSSVPPSSLYRT